MNGKTGIEYVYDEKLRGLFGKKIYEVDASGRLLQEKQMIPAVAGEDIFTFLTSQAKKLLMMS